MKIIISGGAGFIGSHLCERLMDAGHEIIVIDNLSSGFISNLDTVYSDITFINKAIEDFDFTGMSNIDAVVHLAAQASVQLSINNFYKSSRTNILSSIKIIDFCSQNNIPLVYASSSAIYGALNFGDDELNNFDLLSPYATDKFTLELYAKVANIHSNLSSIGLRFFNVYGPRQDPNSNYSGVISIFINNMLSNKDIKINGGYQSRDFIYVNDVVQIIEKAIHKAKEEIFCESVNVLTGKSTTIDELANMLYKITNSKSKKTYHDLQVGDLEHSSGSTNKIQAFFKEDLKDFVSLDRGIKLIINEIRDE